jgi:acyl-CoA thioesterase FadM
MLARLAPKTARGRTGELRIQRVGVDHYREAMPFDQIEVQVHVDRLHERGVSLSVELYRDGEKGLEKLAVGSVDGVWFAPGPQAWEVARFPQQLLEGLSRGIQK